MRPDSDCTTRKYMYALQIDDTHLLQGEKRYRKGMVVEGEEENERDLMRVQGFMPDNFQSHRSRSEFENAFT